MQKIALISRDQTSELCASRFVRVGLALEAQGLTPMLVRYDEAQEDAFEEMLLKCCAALVWVNPIQDGRFRRGLDAVLRRAAAAGVQVSAHPDVIDKMGVKAVLARTREIGWSGDAHFYANPDALLAEFPARLQTGPRVLKQNRGHSGIGVWRVEARDGDGVEVMEAAGGRPAHQQTLASFLDARIAEFADVDGFVDQAFQPRLSDGMIRCYMCGENLAGFGWQRVQALLSAERAEPRTYSGANDRRFQNLRKQMEEDWTPALMRTLGLAADALPVLWDADFLFGPRTARGEDTFVLCEINVSSVSPMPDEAAAAIAAALRERLSN